MPAQSEYNHHNDRKEVFIRLQIKIKIMLSLLTFVSFSHPRILKLCVPCFWHEILSFLTWKIQKTNQSHVCSLEFSLWRSKMQSKTFWDRFKGHCKAVGKAQGCKHEWLLNHVCLDVVFCFTCDEIFLLYWKYLGFFWGRWSILWYGIENDSGSTRCHVTCIPAAC